MAEIKYEGYIKQAQSQLRQMKRLEEMVFPDGIRFSEIDGLSIEAKEKLERFRPRSLAQASRISGVSQASLSLLAMYLSREKKEASSEYRSRA